MRKIIEAIRYYLWRRRFARILRRYLDNCPTGVAFNSALDLARIDNEAWLAERSRAARRQ